MQVPYNVGQVYKLHEAFSTLTYTIQTLCLGNIHVHVVL